MTGALMVSHMFLTGANKICIGIHVQHEPERLRQPLSSVRAHTSQSFEILLLLHGPPPRDSMRMRSLPTLNSLPQLATPEAICAAACFNRLAAHSAADVLVFLESGAQTAPGWLDYLIAALNSDQRNGLAGPSTNQSWNEQCVYPRSNGSPSQILADARDAATRFGYEVRTLEPLYSLAEFCYVVRRAVIETIGAADESYGLGPCWEMDYNIRAARAGWRGVWACGAYVHRTPFTARRRQEEAFHFEASKHRYQDKFCAGRLSGRKTDYRDHCRGDACPNFAPSQLIELKRAFDVAASKPAVPPAVADMPTSATVATHPLVSCI